MTGPQALVDALTASGWTVAGRSERQCYVRLSCPYRTGTASLMIPTDPGAPEYAEMMRAALDQIRRAAQLGDLAWRVLAQVGEPGSELGVHSRAPIDLLRSPA